jgi:hypothetical protein
MRVAKLRIDGQEFYLPPEVDVAALREQLLAAVTGRPAFVEFRSVGRGEVSVLVTQQVPIRFEIEERSEAQMDEWDADPASIGVSEVFPTF